MKLQAINDIMTTEQALELCRHFKLDYLIKRIESSSGKYKTWKFDGCSDLPDEVTHSSHQTNKRRISWTLNFIII